MTRHIRRYWFAGIVVSVAFVAGGFASANEQTRATPIARAAANVLFFPYPAVVSTAAAHPAKSQHLRYLFKGTFDALDAAALSRYDKNIHPDLSQVARLTPQAASPNSLPAPTKPRGDIASEDDEWHFHANPQLGVNHEHEKGMTFSVRRDF